MALAANNSSDRMEVDIDVIEIVDDDSDIEILESTDDVKSPSPASNVNTSTNQTPCKPSTSQTKALAIPVASSSNSIARQPQNTVARLPQSIETAAARYLENYSKHFKGQAKEMVRLKSLAQGKIYLLRKKAPTFYDSRLANLVNQAGSALLMHNVETPEGRSKFNTTHQKFLQVLDELAKSQPAEGVDVDFQAECDRIQERDRLLKEHLRLRQKVSQLEATEIDFDSIGDDDPESSYAKFLHDLEQNLAELKKCSLMIAKIEGERVDEEVRFELKVEPRSILSKLTMEERKKLEGFILEMLKKNQNLKWNCMIDYTVMESHIERLQIEASRFRTLLEKRDLVKDALDAFTSYFREIDNAKRHAFHESLLQDQYLRPKEGMILSGPNDLPPEVIEKMENEDRYFQRRVDEVTEKYSILPCPEADSDKGEIIYEEGDDNNIDPTVEVVEEYIKSNQRLFIARVKEEPRDDYNYELPSDDETVVPEAEASNVENAIQVYNNPSPTPRTP